MPWREKANGMRRISAQSCDQLLKKIRPAAAVFFGGRFTRQSFMFQRQLGLAVARDEFDRNDGLLALGAFADPGEFEYARTFHAQIAAVVRAVAGRRAGDQRAPGWCPAAARRPGRRVREPARQRYCRQ